MRLGLGNNLVSGGGSLFTSDANAYIAALKTAGVIVTPNQRNAITTFITTGNSEGWYPLLKRLYLPIWGSAAPNAIDLVTRTSGSFVGNVQHGVGFVKATDSTGYFDFNVSPQALGLTQFNAGLMGWVDIQGGNVPIIGTKQTDNSTFYLRTTDGPIGAAFACFYTWSDGTQAAIDGNLYVVQDSLPSNPNIREGIITSYGFNGALSMYRRNDSSRIVVGNKSVAGFGTVPTTTIKAMGNADDGSGYWGSRTSNCYAFAAMNGMSDNMDEKFTAALYQFRTNML
jgi:hypothetical protein